MIDHKHYVRDIGTVPEKTIKGGSAQRNALVSVRHGGTS